MQRALWIGLVFFIVAMLVAPGSSAQPRGLCHTTEVPGPIMLPDNSIEESGRLEVCLSRMYSPVSGLHRTSVNGHISGLFVSRRISPTTKSNDDRPRFTFSRLADGTYALESYALPYGEELVTFELRPGQVRSRWHVRQARADTTRVVMPASVAVGF